MSLTRACKLTACCVTAVVSAIGFAQVPTRTGLLWTAVTIIAFSAWLVFRTADDACAALYAPHYIVVIMITGLLQRWSTLVEGYDPEIMSNIGLVLNENSVLAAILFISIVAVCLGIVNNKLRIAAIIGSVLVSTSLSLLVYTTPDAKMLRFVDGGLDAVVILILSVFALAIAFLVAYAINKEASNPAFALTVGCIVVLGYFNVSCMTYVMPTAKGLCDGILELPTGLFAWWRVIPVFIVLLIVSRMLSTEDYSSSNNPDSIVLASMALLVIAARLLMSNYFVYSFVPYVAFLSICILCIQRYAHGKLIMGVRADYFLALAFVVFVSFVVSVTNTIVPNFALTLVLALYAFRKRGLFDSSKSLMRMPFGIVIALFAEVLAWQSCRGFSIDGLEILATMLFISCLSLWVMKKGLIDNSKRGPIYVTVAYGCVLLMCAVSLRSPIAITAKEEGGKQQVHIEVHGSDNTVKDATYAWRDYLGNEIESGLLESEKTNTVSIRSDVLIVVVSDARGSVARRTYYFPAWTHKFGKKQLEAPRS